MNEVKRAALQSTLDRLQHNLGKIQDAVESYSMRVRDGQTDVTEQSLEEWERKIAEVQAIIDSLEK